MRVKELIEYLKTVDQELEIDSSVSEDCCCDYSTVYGIEPAFYVETLYEYNEHIYTELEDVVEAIEIYEGIDENEAKLVAVLIKPVDKLIISLAP